MGLLRRHKFEILTSIGVILLFFFLRLLFLTKLPIFTDEAIYLRWSQISLHDASWRFISLTDGKQPLFVWLTMLSIKVFSEPLFSGRLISVLSGFSSVILLFLISLSLFKSKKIGLLTSLTYVCYPFAQVYDRMALYDSLAGALTLLSLYLAILLVKKIRLDIALLLGFSIGLGVLNKSTNFFSMYLLPFTLAIYKKTNLKWSRFLQWCGYVIVAVVIAEGMYGVLRLSPLYNMVITKNALFIYPFAEWITHPFNFFFGNLSGLSTWLFEYLKVPYILLIFFAFFDKKFLREKLMLFLYFVLPFLALALFARILFPRFIFFMTLSLLPLAGYSLGVLSDLIKVRIKKLGTQRLGEVISLGLVISVFLSYPLFVSYSFATDPVHADIATPDSAQYANHWTAGWGVTQSVDYLKKEAENGKIYVGTEGTFGLLPFALELYLIDNPNVTIKGYWPLEGQLPDDLVAQSKIKNTFIIFYQPNNITPPNIDHLKLIQKTKEGTSNYYYRLYQVVGY